MHALLLCLYVGVSGIRRTQHGISAALVPGCTDGKLTQVVENSEREKMHAFD